MNLGLADEKTRVRSGSFPAVVTKIKTLAAQTENVLKLTVGDAITGVMIFTLFKGEGDEALMNEVCFDAFVHGNNEFDEGDTGLAKVLNFL